MKCLALLMTVAIVQVNATTYAQRINLHQRNGKMVDVLREIKKQTGYDFFYSRDLIRKAAPVTIIVKNVDLQLALEQIFSNQEFDYAINDSEHVIVIKPKKEGRLAASTVTRPGQDRPLSGTISDEAGHPLAGISVQVKGKPISTTTNEQGAFTLSLPDDATHLVFSSIGYISQEVPVGNQDQVQIRLAASVSDLDEVVVVGYGTQTRAKVVGSISSVDSKALTAAPVSNVTNALAGRLPGLISKQSSGLPGQDAASLNIRGFGSALVIVDGIQSSFSYLDPEQIQSITILKDAAATVYGARAGNGVILVTTKRGIQGKLTFSVNLSTTWQGITSFPRMVNSGEYTELARELHINSGMSPETAPFSAEDIERFKRGEPGYPSTDWYKELIRPLSPMNHYNISVRGGNDAIKYYGYLGYLDQETAFRKGGGGYKRYSFQSNIDAKVNEDFQIQLSTSAGFHDRDYPITSINEGGESVWSFLWSTFPIYPAALPDPSKISFAGGNGTGGAQVVSNRDLSGYNDSFDKNLMGSISLNYKLPFFKAISLKAFASYEGWDNANKRFSLPVSLYTYEPTGGIYTLAGKFGDKASMHLRDDEGRTLTGQFSIDFNKAINDHQIDAKLLYEVTDYSSSYLTAGRMNFLSTEIDQLYAGNSATSSNSGSATENGRISYVGRLNYSFRDKYLFESIFRADATPVFAAASRWGYFPSALLGWRISEEQFMDWRNLDELKLKVSYGKSGNDYSSNNIYRYLAGYALSNDPYILGSRVDKGIRSTGIANPAVTWENVTTYNAAVDFSLFKSKLYGEFNVFYRSVTDILGSRSGSLPSTFGSGLPLENINSSDDRGFELEMGTTGLTARGLMWGVQGNVSWSRSKWINYDEPEYTDPDQKRISQRSGVWKNRTIGYLTDGLFTSAEEIANWPLIQDNNGNTTLLPGDVKIVDFNGDAKIDGLDQTEIGKSTMPNWMAGLNISLSYKNFDFSTLVQGAFGFYTRISYNQGQVYPKFVYEDRWTPENNDPDALPRLGGSGGGGYNLATSDLWFRNASYARVKSLTIGYSFSADLLQRINVSQMRLYAAGTNLFTIDGLKRYSTDPEAPSARVGLYYPQQQTLSLGLTISL